MTHDIAEDGQAAGGHAGYLYGVTLGADACGVATICHEPVATVEGCFGVWPVAGRYVELAPPSAPSDDTHCSVNSRAVTAGPGADLPDAERRQSRAKSEPARRRAKAE